MLLFDIGSACYLCRRGSQTIAIDQIIIILLGALAGGIVNGLTGFGTGITAIGLWLYTISPLVAASLVIICSVVSHLQTLPMIWHAIKWKRVLPFVVPGFVGVPVGTMLLSQVDPRMFKIGVGLFLVSYATYVLARKVQISAVSGGRIADGAVGFCGGVLGGLAGLSGALLVYGRISAATRKNIGEVSSRHSTYPYLRLRSSLTHILASLRGKWDWRH